MTLFPKKYINKWLNIPEYLRFDVFNWLDLRKELVESIFVDTSPYSASLKSHVKWRYIFFRTISILVGCLLAYSLNNKLVYQLEAIDTFRNINNYLGLGFILTGTLVLSIIFILHAKNSIWCHYKNLEKTLQTTGLLFVSSGFIFILLCVSKYISLLNFPALFDFKFKLGIFTFYLAQAGYFLGYSFCFYLILIGFYRILFFGDRLSRI